MGCQYTSNGNLPPVQDWQFFLQHGQAWRVWIYQVSFVLALEHSLCVSVQTPLFVWGVIKQYINNSNGCSPQPFPCMLYLLTCFWSWVIFLQLATYRQEHKRALKLKSAPAILANVLATYHTWKEYKITCTLGYMSRRWNVNVVEFLRSIAFLSVYLYLKDSELVKPQQSKFLTYFIR